MPETEATSLCFALFSLLWVLQPHSFADAVLTGSLADSPIHSPGRSPTHPPNHSLTHSLNHSLIRSLARSLGFVLRSECVHNVQGQMLEIQATLITLAACWMHPLPSLNRHRPQQRISGRYGLALLAIMACCLQLSQLTLMGFLCTRPWFQGGSGNSSWVSICMSLCTYLSCEAVTYCFVFAFMAS